MAKSMPDSPFDRRVCNGERLVDLNGRERAGSGR